MSKFQDRFAERFAAKQSQRNTLAIQADVTSYEVLGEKGVVAKVVANVSGTRKPAAIRRAIEQTLGGRAHCIEASFRAVPTNGDSDSIVVVGFVAAQRESRMIETRRGLQEIAKNVLMDTSDNSVWDVRKVGGKEYMYRQQQENLSELLELAHVRTLGVPRLDKMRTGHTEVANYITYVDTKDAEVRYGYGAGSDGNMTLVMCRVTGGLTQVDNKAIITVTNFNRDPKERKIHASLIKAGNKLPKILNVHNKVTAGVITADAADYDYSNVDYKNLHDYYKAIYAYAPDYFNEIEKIINAYGF